MNDETPSRQLVDNELYPTGTFLFCKALAFCAVPIIEEEDGILLSLFRGEDSIVLELSPPTTCNRFAKPFNPILSL